MIKPRQPHIYLLSLISADVFASFYVYLPHHFQLSSLFSWLFSKCQDINKYYEQNISIAFIVATDYAFMSA